MFQATHVIARQKLFEGFRARPYKCSMGVWTIGYGATIWLGERVTAETRIVTQAKAHDHMKKDTWTALSDCQWIYKHVFHKLSQVEQEVLIHMAFQLGGTKLKKFVRMNEAIGYRDTDSWAEEMTDSLWWTQTPRPAAALRTALLEDEWPPKWQM